jgi:hypothetical protein
MSPPLTATEVLDGEFLAMRSRLIDLAAVLDRIDRAEGAQIDDPRLEKIRQGLQILADKTTDRTEQIQLLFSLSYEEGWQEDYGL